MNHYVVIRDYAMDGSAAINIIGVTHSMESAKSLLKKNKQEEIQFANDNNYTIVTNSNECFEAWKDGYYVEEHTKLYIEIV